MNIDPKSMESKSNKQNSVSRLILANESAV